MTTFQCELCLPKIRVFKRKQGLNEHIKLKHGKTPQEPVLCDICNLPFVNDQSLNTHKNKYHPDEQLNYPCSKCDFIGLTKSGLDSHLKTHEEPTFKCEQCDLSYYHKTSLTKHIKTSH